MSVLNQSGEEQVECPLCMEPLEVDDLNFYPCTCGYQICRFCWHRIRTDENGLCPACRKAYSENPADFTPLSKEQVAQLKAEKRQRDQQRKAKLSESRKHLASVRVVQKNLVFVVGLPVRLADADVLKRHEYFGKFGKIHKVVINQSTSYAGSQGPSASAYVTYCKSDDALRAIQNVNNITLDGRLIKSSLGTTKYCSHFMKNQPCPKADCMYLHDFGDPEASFTKEQMHLGKHQEYEKKLHDGLLSRAAAQQQTTPATNGLATTSEKGVSQQQSTSGATPPVGVPEGTKVKQQNGQKEPNNWPTLSTTGDTNGYPNNTKTEKPQKSETKSEKSQKKSNQKNKNNNNSNSTNNNLENSIKVKCKETSNSNNNKNNCEQSCQNQQITEKSINSLKQTPVLQHNTIKELVELPTTVDCLENLSKMQLIDDNSSFFSHNSFQKLLPDHDSSSYDSTSSSATPHSAILNDNLPDINSSEDWQAAFGFGGALKPQNGVTAPQPRNVDTRNTQENGFTGLKHGLAEMLDQLEAEYQKSHNPNGFVEHSKQSENILDMLTGTHFGAAPYKMDPNERLGPGSNGGFSNHHKLGESNGLDQQMSKFFAEFNNKHQHSSNPGYLQNTNGYLSNMSENNRQGYHNNSETPQQQQHNLLVYQQRYLDKQLEEHALFNLKQNVYNNPQQQQYIQQQQQQQQQQLQHHNSSQQFLTNGDHYLNQNGQNYGNPPYPQNSVYQNPNIHQQRNQVPHRERSNVEDDLGFDPFHETQKGLAELIESEQGVSQLQQATNILNQSSISGHSANGTSSGPVNGLVHGGSGPASAPGSCLPPPPPGFMQHNAHMNSFGSKILPFLNMSSSQQANSSGGWTTYSEAHLKGLAPVNDWTTLDPAIVSSSRHFPLASLQPLRGDQYSPFQPQPPQQQQPLTNGGPMRGYDYSQTNGYTNTTFGNNITQQQPPHNLQSYANSYATHLNQTTPQNGLNWYGNDLHGQISSPPGFRQTTAATSKTQEC